MTMTESPPVEAAKAEPKAAAEVAAEDLYTWLSTSDHKVIGRIWIRLSLALFVAAAALGAAVAIEEANGTDEVFGGLNAYFQMWGLYRFGLVLLVAAPLFVGLATVVVPMQVGSTNIAFPRAALAAAWGYVLGSIITIVSVLAGGGWGALDGVSAEEADAIELTLLGTGMVLGSLMLASVCIVTTVISLRTPGMGLAKVPLFAWSMLVTGTVWLLTMPIVLANLIVIVVDLRGGPLLFGNPEPTGSSATLIFDQLAWVLEQPQVYSVAIPVLGVIGSVIPVVARGRHASHAAAMVTIGLAGLLAIGGWSQPHFGDHRDEFVFVAFGLVFVVPVLATLALAGLTLLKGEAPVGIPPAHLLGALGSGLLLLLAATAGALRVIDPLELIGTTADTAVFSLTVFAAVTGGVTGVWFWAPKIGGRQLSAALGSLAVTALVGAGAFTGVGGVVAGFDEAPNWLTGDLDGLTQSMAWLIAAGVILVVIGSLTALGAIVLSLRSEIDAGDDPWGGHTLEWATATPVPVDNFTEPVARVTSEAPLLDVTGEVHVGTEGEES